MGNLRKFAFLELRAETQNFNNGQWKYEQIGGGHYDN